MEKLPARRTATASALVVACAGTTSARAGADSNADRVSRTSAPAACHVTLPNGSSAPGEAKSETFHGKNGLWTALPPDGVLRITTRTPLSPGETLGRIFPDGSLSTKFPWFGSRSAATKLTIRGTRLDGPARKLRLTAGPGATAGSPHFWATRLRFATPGCWRVSGRSGRAHLTFTVTVQRAAN